MPIIYIDYIYPYPMTLVTYIGTINIVAYNRVYN